MKIYKYPLEFKPEQTIDIPMGSNIIALQMQGKNPCIWAIVSPEAKTTPVIFRMYMTGEEIDNPQSKAYVGTVQNMGYVLHFFIDNPPLCLHPHKIASE